MDINDDQPITTTTTSANTIESTDAAVIGTADDAIFAKLATVQAKYYADPFIEAFLPRKTSSSSTRQPSQQIRHTQPIIKRGTHARVCCMDRAIIAAIQSVTTATSLSNQPPPPKLAVVCLGSGKDTSFFRYRAGLLLGQSSMAASASSNHHPICWYEVDHPVVIQEKIHMIETSPLLSAKYRIQREERSSDGCCFALVEKDVEHPTILCHFIGHDLRNPPDELIQQLTRTMINNSTTAILWTMECVQMYLPDQSSRNLWSALSTAFPNSCLCIYDAIIGNDPFGQMMEQNLLDAGMIVKSPPPSEGDDQDSCSSSSSSSSLLQTRTLPEQMNKLYECGWHRVVGCDMWNAYQSVITPEQRRHANRCEFLDEVEEWMLIMKHYGVVVATNQPPPGNNNDNNKVGSWGHWFCQVGPAAPMGFQAALCHVVTTANKSMPPAPP